MKNILIVTGHPAQIHNFRNLYFNLNKMGNKMYWVTTKKEITLELLLKYSIDYYLLDKAGKTMMSKIIAFIKNNYLMYKYLRNNNIDLVVSRISPFIILPAWILRIKHIAFTDTETAGKVEWILSQFVTTLYTSNSFKKNLRKDQKRFNANIELFYLHPNVYKPKGDSWDLLGLKSGEKYVIVRFVSWDAYHDRGISGLSYENKIKAIHEISKYAKVFISSEHNIPLEISGHAINIPIERMHDVLADAILFFGESATMASEAAMLGTPAIYIDEYGRGYTDEEAYYGLVFNYRSSKMEQERAIAKAVEILRNANIKNDIRSILRKFMKSHIDPTEYFTWLINEYPQSTKTIYNKNIYEE